MRERLCVAKAKKNKKNKKLSRPVRAALERGDIVPESALRGRKVPKSVKTAFMRASVQKMQAAEKAAAPVNPVYMVRKGDASWFPACPWWRPASTRNRPCRQCSLARCGPGTAVMRE